METFVSKWHLRGELISNGNWFSHERISIYDVYSRQFCYTKEEEIIQMDYFQLV